MKRERFPEDTLSARNSETLLLAENDKLVRSLISLILKQHGYRVIEAEDGNQAVEKYIAHKADISALVLDVILPKRSGKEVYDFIRNVVPDIRTLFISGYATEMIEKKGVEECYHVITKPFTPGMFLEAMRKVLD
jgi:two-component system cell cycle sensor histidine kinase/response regulator CckA